MKYSDIKLSTDQTYFLYNNTKLFDKNFIQALKFHSEGLAAVYDGSGWYHIDLKGKSLYKKRYDRVFGYYCDRAAIVDNDTCFHIDTDGKRVYTECYAWCGNYQEYLCTVRDYHNRYFHIDKNGKKLYQETYTYAGDFKDGFACVRLQDGYFRHIDMNGVCLNDKKFHDLGIFHKGIATAKDRGGWFHCNREGHELYSQRYLQIEVFYNGFALVQDFENSKHIINEKGETELIL